MRDAIINPISTTGPESLWPVYLALFAAKKDVDHQHNQMSEAIFVQTDRAAQSGHLMGPEVFLTDTIIGTKHVLASDKIPHKMPTFKGKRLIGRMAPKHFSLLDAVCRPVATFEEKATKKDLTPWAELAMREVESLQILLKHSDVGA